MNNPISFLLLIKKIQDHFRVTVLESEDGSEFKDETDILFVCPDFDNYSFRYLNSLKKSIVGPPLIRHRASQHKVPVYEFECCWM